MSVFGFSTETATGDFIPIIKYDARFGTFSRVDRVDNGNGFENHPVDITSNFKILADFENIEVGWADFGTGGAPSFVLVRRQDVKEGKVAFPRQPSENHKQAVRFMCKLAPAIGGDKPVREICNNSKTFLGGLEQIVEEYLQVKERNPDKLPQLVLDGAPAKIKTGTGSRVSENYRPRFRIIGWSPRGDLVFVPKAVTTGTGMATGQEQRGNERRANGGTPPNTGSRRAEPPPQQPRPQQQQRPATDYDPNDFG